MDTDAIVLESYSKRLVEQAGPGPLALQLCSAETYDHDLLRRVPKAITEADYGCGNPSKWAQPGDAVLDLGSGSGKICYILSQIVGSAGKVIGVDMNRDMLALARKHQAEFACDVGYDNMTFLMGRIQDLQTNLELIDSMLSNNPVSNISSYLELEQAVRKSAVEQPLVEDNSVDLIVSNCVINLVRAEDKSGVFREMFRVLRPGGRIAISDNVSSVDVSNDIKNDPQLWATCYGGVFQEQKFYAELEAAGFAGIRIEVRREIPNRSIGNVHFRSVTVTATKPSALRESCCGNKRAQEVVYRGPWKEVVDDRGNQFKRGHLTAVTSAQWETLSRNSYRDEMIFVGSEDLSTQGARRGQTDPASDTKSSCCS